MNAVTGFVAIVSLLLALAAAGGPAKEPAGLITPSKLATNHNETLVTDTAARQADTLSRLLAGVQSVVFANFSFNVGGSCPPFACGTDSNRSETLVSDTAPVK